MKTRKRNPRGEGTRLREEIVDAAARLVDEGGPPAVTLRAVAREAGISAPSIYDHFPDRAAILLEVKLRFLEQLDAYLRDAIEPYEDSVERLLAGCQAYVSFSDQFPTRYAYLFMYEPGADADIPHGGPPDGTAKPFETLIETISDCVSDGRSTSADPRSDATAVWSALHGYALLYPAMPTFPWPARQDMLMRIVRGLAGVAG